MNEQMNVGHRPMRRANKEVFGKDELRAIVERSSVLRLAQADGEGTFIVPMSFGFEWDAAAEAPTFWLHGSGEGRKADAWRADPHVALELDGPCGVISGDYACAYSLAYESIMAWGRIAQVADTAEKVHGLTCIMEHMAPGAPLGFVEAAVERVSVWRVDVERLTGKHRQM